ncbi:MAG: sigma 54-interacting transcriptional regulator [Clostridium sp.]
MNTTIEKARRFAETSSNIMLLGESGTGKELFAQSIHNCSKRTGWTPVAISCAALPENLLESELFGYVQGCVYRCK